MKPEPVLCASAAELADDDFIARFEDCTLPNTAFHHRDHVRLAWLYLCREPPLAALTRFVDSLKRFAHANGHDGLYHETITWAYLFLIRERMLRTQLQSWEEFAAGNPDLLIWQRGAGGLLSRYYRAETLASRKARETFLFPDALAQRNSGR